MSGYTPVFQSVFTGTLHGRWPDVGLWLCLLGMADKEGVLDCTPSYIAATTGLAVAAVEGCIERFMEPDPQSRSTEEGGRRLVLLEPPRSWGWRIVNFAKYRERARLKAKAERETANGLNAARMQDRRRPPGTAADPLSNANAYSNKKEEGEGAKRAPTAKRLGPDFQLTEARRFVAKVEDVDPDKEFRKFCDYWGAESGAKARKHDWDATWRNWCRRAGEFRPRHGKPVPEPEWHAPED